MAERGEAGPDPAPRDTIALAVAAAVVAVLAVLLPLFGVERHRDPLVALIVGVLCVAVLSIWRRGRDLRAEAARRSAAERELRRLRLRLEEVTANLHSLRGLLAMCSWCKSIRDGAGDWRPLEDYLEHHLHASLTHAVCPECMRVEYPGLFEEA